MRLDADDWRARAAAHADRADALTRPRRERKARGQFDPVEDFLFMYYPYRPAQLRKWHPGAGVVLAGAPERRDWRWYANAVDGDFDADSVEVDTVDFRCERGDTLDYIAELLSRTLRRRGTFGCFGMHEWAMVYRSDLHGTRHSIPLRLGPDETDRIVESNRIVCSHFDAFRFFSPEATGMNALTPTRETAPSLEQPACLHAGMDVYKWAIKLGPVIPGELLLDAFALARDIRVVDMRASPYDLSGWGYSPIPVETAAGKASYVAAQRDFAERGNALRERILTAIGPLVEGAPAGSP